MHTQSIHIYTLHTMMYCTFLYYQTQFLLVEKPGKAFFHLEENVVPVILVYVYIKKQQRLH